MSDGSLPYLGDITITPKLPSDGNKVFVTITWTVQSIRPSVIEIYALFGSSAANLLDLAQRFDTVATNASPVTIPLTGANYNPFLYIGVAPRNLEGDGITKADEMVDASGELQPWESFASQEGFNITYTTPPPQPRPAPPHVSVAGVSKTLNQGDLITVTVTASNADAYNMIEHEDGSDNAQLSNNTGVFVVPSTPGKSYTFRAEQRNRDSKVWSLFSVPTPFIGPPRLRSLRSFLSLSGVLAPGTGVRQYAIRTSSSIRSMMGL